jgi:hypothetical protein
LKTLLALLNAPLDIQGSANQIAKLLDLTAMLNFIIINFDEVHQRIITVKVSSQ